MTEELHIITCSSGPDSERCRRLSESVDRFVPEHIPHTLIVPKRDFDWFAPLVNPRGMPTVTTPVGAEGIAAEHARHLMVADNAASTVKHIPSLLEDQSLWDHLQSESRALVRKRHTWQCLFDSMHREIRLALEDHSSTSILEVKSGVHHAS